MPGSILVTDADGETRETISEALRRAGHHTCEAGDGDEALALAEASRPELIVAEVLLPRISGYELCHVVKARMGSALPVVLMSERRADPADRVAGLLIGADDYIVKPFLPAELVVRVHRLLTRQQEVLGLLADGFSPVEIANRLYITRRTVRKHVERILSKLAVHSQAQAVALALRETPRTFP